MNKVIGMSESEAILHMKQHRLIPENIDLNLEISFVANIPIFTLVSETQIEGVIPLNTHRTGFDESGKSYILRFIKTSEINKIGGIGHELIHIFMRSLKDEMPYSYIKDKEEQSKIRSFVEEIFCYSFNQVSKDGNKNNFTIMTPDFILNNFFYLKNNGSEDLDKYKKYKEVSQKLSILLSLCGKDIKGYLLVRLKQIRKYCSSLQEIENFLDKEITLANSFLKITCQF